MEVDMSTVTISYDTNNKVANSIVNMMRQSGLFKFEDEQYSIPEPETLEPFTMVIREIFSKSVEPW